MSDATVIIVLFGAGLGFVLAREGMGPHQLRWWAWTLPPVTVVAIALNLLGVK